MNDHIKNVKRSTGRWPDFSGRNAFDYYVLQSQYHRKLNIEWGVDPEKCHAWGSARFCREWIEKNLQICPTFIPQKDSLDKLKTVLMLPHWSYNVDKPAVLDLLDRMVELPWIHLIIKDHTRGTGGLPRPYRDMYNGYSNVETSVSGHSPALVQWSDVVINFGSSIGIEALQQDKYLINPRYLHTNTTIFDDTGASLEASGEHETLELLRSIRGNTAKRVPVQGKEALYKAVIYGGREPFDVLDKYCAEITSKPN